MFFFFTGLNFVSRSRELFSGHPYQSQQQQQPSSAYTAMECDSSPSTGRSQQQQHHPHRTQPQQVPQRYHQVPQAVLNHGPGSLPYALTGHSMMHQSKQQHNSINQGAQVVPQQSTKSRQQDGTTRDSNRDDSSPMVGVCLQPSPVVIH